MTQEVKMKLSVGSIILLAVVAVGHATWLGAINNHSANQISDKLVPNLSVPVYQQHSVSKPVQALPQPIETNYRAQGEMKQQCGPNGCTVNPSSQAAGMLHPGALYPGRRLPDGSIVTHVGVPEVQVASPPRVVQNQRDKPAPKTLQLLVFSNDDSLVSWFDSGDLARVKASSSFQRYKSNGELYLSRFAKIVPPDQFPAIILQDAEGGHIGAWGKSYIPSTAAQLYDDMRDAYTLYKQAKQGSDTVLQGATSGAIKGEGYSWDDAISPQMKLSDECGPDGCPPQWRPGDRVRDGLDNLFNRNKNPLEALFWGSGTEIVQIVIAIVLGCLVILIAFYKVRG